MNYRLLATDIDGTLLKKDGTLSENNIRALQRLERMGVPVVLVTGRALVSTRMIWDVLKTNYPVVCFGGSMIADTKTGKTLYSKVVSPELATEAVLLANGLGLHSQLYVDEHIVYEREGERVSRYRQKLGINGVVDPHMAEKRWEGVHKVLYFAPPAELDVYCQRVAEHFEGRLEVSASMPDFVELIHLGVCKGGALRHVAEMLGVEMSEVVAVGDSIMDISMLNAAGMGVAVGNAHDDVKAEADFIAPPADDDAIEYIVNTFFD